MAVLIKGLTKPQSCGDCWADDWFCNRWRDRNWGMPPPDDCPIEAAPTDVVERENGKWVEECPDCLDGDAVYVCSVCGETWNLIEGTPKDNNMNFCPCCGADMKGDRINAYFE